MLLLAIALASGQAAPSAPGKALATQDEDQRVKCHVEEVTGTLAGHRRVCHTVAEWRMISDRAIEKATEMRDNGLISPSHGN